MEQSIKNLSLLHKNQFCFKKPTLVLGLSSWLHVNRSSLIKWLMLLLLKQEACGLIAFIIKSKALLSK